MKKRFPQLDDDNFLTDWDDFSDCAVDLDDLAGTLDFDVSGLGRDLDFDLDGLKDFD